MASFLLLHLHALRGEKKPNKDRCNTSMNIRVVSTYKEKKQSANGHTITISAHLRISSHQEDLLFVPGCKSVNLSPTHDMNESHLLNCPEPLARKKSKLTYWASGGEHGVSMGKEVGKGWLLLPKPAILVQWVLVSGMTSSESVASKAVDSD